MIVGVIADNLGGGSARVCEAILDGLADDVRVTKILLYSNPRVNKPNISKLYTVYSNQLKGWSKVRKRIDFISNLPINSVILNLTNFPVGFSALNGRRELVLLHNAYFFELPNEISFLNSPFFILRNSIGRALMLRLRIFFSSPSATTFIVQSEFMLQIARKYIPLNFKLKVIRPHAWISTEKCTMFPMTSSLDALKNLKIGMCWFYPATGEKHKNHLLLLELFKNAIKINSNIRLILTLPENNNSSKKIMSRIKKLGIGGNIVNIGWINELEKNYLMQNAKGIIFLSRFESLGLPLLEIRDLSRPSLVLFSDIAKEVLGKKQDFYYLFSNEHSAASAERERFTHDLANGCKNLKKYVHQPDINIAQAYFFDIIECENDYKI